MYLNLFAVIRGVDQRLIEMARTPALADQLRGGVRFRPVVGGRALWVSGSGQDVKAAVAAPTA